MQIKSFLAISALAYLVHCHDHTSSSTATTTSCTQATTPSTSIYTSSVSSSSSISSSTTTEPSYTTFTNTATHPITTVLPPWTSTSPPTLQTYPAVILNLPRGVVIQNHHRKSRHGNGTETLIGKVNGTGIVKGAISDIATTTVFTIAYPAANYTFPASTQTIPGTVQILPTRTATIAPSEVAMLKYANGARRSASEMSGVLFLAAVISMSL